uniref:Elongator complex protein 4 n=1 Tax=Lactuca sativa TaxID=4236 RepID=A0A9R1WZQ5_LACSA|nr:hypothetical protein LSAT_V11C800396420 [Lactuca sativa]
MIKGLGSRLSMNAHRATEARNHEDADFHGVHADYVSESSKLIYLQILFGELLVYTNERGLKNCSIFMATGKVRTSSFSKNFSAAPTSSVPGLKYGPNGTIFLSSGIPDLDSNPNTPFLYFIKASEQILGGGFHLGSMVMIMEDTEAPHHMLLLRTFMSQGLVHNQPVLYASPIKNPRAFLGTLPITLVPKDDKSRNTDAEQKDLRIAWQYKKYLGENKQHNEERGNFVSFYPLWGFLIVQILMDSEIVVQSSYLNFQSTHVIITSGLILLNLKVPVVFEGYQIGGAICDGATGATAKTLKLPREDEFWSRGISACAICDGASPIFKGEVLAVVGGGDTGTEEAIYLTKYARHVHLLVCRDQLKASQAMQHRIYLFSRREPEEPDDATKGRDVFNEKPPPDELMAASDIGKSVTTSLPENVVSSLLFAFKMIYLILINNN